MDLLNKFIGYLSSLKNPPAKNTQKNYKADVAQFINWYENTTKSAFAPDKIAFSLIEKYQQIRTSTQPKNQFISGISIKRHLSSLRKFFYFLKIEGIIKKNPFDWEKRASDTNYLDKWYLKSFKNYLYIYNSSDLTIKNYINDLHNFFDWAEKVTGLDKTWDLSQKNILNLVSWNLIDDYKNRLLESGLSPLTINRKLSAIRRFCKWAMESGYINNIDNQETLFKKAQHPLAVLEVEDIFQNQRPDNFSPDKKTQAAYSSFPPLRLIQKSLKGMEILLEKTLVSSIENILDTIDYQLWALSGKPIFKTIKSIQTDSFQKAKDPFSALFKKPVKNVRKSVYAPLEVSTRYFPLHKKLLYYLQHKRPKWYKRYHLFPISHYIHLAVLIVYMTALGFGMYKTFFEDPALKSLLAAPLSPPRLLSFEGRLTDTSDTPVTVKKKLLFSIYNSEKASGSALLWQEQQEISPDFDGVFSVLLGKKTPLSQSIFGSNESLWLGVSVDNDPELKPRQQLATVAFASNSELLQGMPPVTQAGAGSKNVILNLDSSGNLSMNGSPAFQALGGQFKLSGKELVLQTNVGSNTDIVLNPDGTGKIDFRKPILNSTNTSSVSGIPGAVEIADMLAIIATSSGQSALTVSQNSTGPIISASSSGIAKFSLEANGQGYFAGNLRIKTATSDATLNLESRDSPHIKIVYLGNAYATLKVSKDGDLNIDSRGNDLSIPTRTTIGSSTLGDAKLTVTGSEEGKALVILNETGNQALLTASASGTTKFIVQNSGSVGIGTANPSQELEVDGDIKLDLNGTTTTNGLCHSNTDTTDEEIVDCSGAPSDIAEWYAATQWVDEGELVDLTDSVFEYDAEGSDPKTGKIKSIGKQKIQIVDKSRDISRVLGVVSSGPFQVFGEDIKNAVEKSNNKSIKAIPVALAGRVPTKVSLENGPIRFGDYLTTSSIPGIAAKALEPGPVIGMALESFDQSKKYVCAEDLVCGKVLTFINNSWYDPDRLKEYTALEFRQISEGENLEDKIDSLGHEAGLLSDSAYVSLQAQFVIAQGLSSKNLKATQALIENLTSSLVTAQTLMATSRIISPVGEIDRLNTRMVSPLASDATVSLSFQKDKIEIVNPKATDSALVSFDDKGNATFSGKLSSNELIIDKDATVSGTLRARKIIADEVEGLKYYDATPSATQVTNITNVYQTASTASASLAASASAEIDSKKQNINASLAQLEDQSSLDDLQTFTSDFEPLEKLEAQFATFRDGLMAYGPTTLAELSVTGQLSVDATFIITRNSINVLGDTLELQPFRQGGISFLSGKVVIDTDGNAQFFGNASFAQNVEVKGELSANIVKPIPDHDLVVSLSSKDPTDSAGLVVANASGSAVLRIDNAGSLTSSGSAEFKDFLTHSFKIIRQAQADTSVTETVATSSAGFATITAGYTYRIIVTPHVRKYSLIYISPTSDTSEVTPYIASQVPFDSKEENQPSPSGSFTIRIPKPVQKDIHLNWWIVN